MARAYSFCCICCDCSDTRPPMKWSQCSTDTLALSFQQGLDACMYNTPQTIFQPTTSTCGNGIVERGEQCDCGNAPSQVSLLIHDGFLQILSTRYSDTVSNGKFNVSYRKGSYYSIQFVIHMLHIINSRHSNNYCEF